MEQNNQFVQINKNIIVYLRTSTEEQNPENQKKDCLELAKKYGDLIDIFEDKQSAWKDTSRVGFNEAENRIRSAKVKHFVVWDLDRIYRNRLKLKAFFEMCKIYGCVVHSVRQEWLESINNIQPPFNDIMNELLLNILGWMAEDESNKKSDRVKAAVRKKGKKTISYKGNKWGRRSISSYKRNLIKEAYNQNKSIRKIASELDIGIGSVHKYLAEIKQEKALERGVR